MPTWPEMEVVPCNLCGRCDTKPRSVSPPWSVVQCRHCRLAYLNPRPCRPDQLYGEEYFKAYFANLTGAASEREIKRRTLSEAWKVRRLLTVKAGGRLLDIGCGGGFFLHGVRELGWEVWGNDVSSWASGFASRLQIPIIEGYFQEALFPPGLAFDVITLWDNLEHQQDPTGTLLKAKSLLAEDGWLVVCVPNIASFDARLFPEKLDIWHLPYHFYHFTPTTIQALFTKTGYRVVKIERVLSELLWIPLQRLAAWRDDTHAEAALTELLPQGPKLRSSVRAVLAATIGRIFSGYEMICYVRKG